MKTNTFDINLKNLQGTLAVENMKISEIGINNLKRMENGEANYIEIIEELKKKFAQRG